MPPSDVALGGGSSWSSADASSLSASSLPHSALYCLTWRTPSGCSTAPVVGCLCGHGLHGSCAVKPQGLALRALARDLPQPLVDLRHLSAPPSLFSGFTAGLGPVPRVKRIMPEAI